MAPSGRTTSCKREPLWTAAHVVSQTIAPAQPLPEKGSHNHVPWWGWTLIGGLVVALVAVVGIVTLGTGGNGAAGLSIQQTHSQGWDAMELGWNSLTPSDQTDFCTSANMLNPDYTYQLYVDAMDPGVPVMQYGEFTQWVSSHCG